jgi:hypothetical protein
MLPCPAGAVAVVEDVAVDLLRPHTSHPDPAPGRLQDCNL